MNIALRDIELSTYSVSGLYRYPYVATEDGLVEKVEKILSIEELDIHGLSLVGEGIITYGAPEQVLLQEPVTRVVFTLETKMSSVAICNRITTIVGYIIGPLTLDAELILDSVSMRREIKRTGGGDVESIPTRMYVYNAPSTDDTLTLAPDAVLQRNKIMTMLGSQRDEVTVNTGQFGTWLNATSLLPEQYMVNTVGTGMDLLAAEDYYHSPLDGDTKITAAELDVTVPHLTILGQLGLPYYINVPLTLGTLIERCDDTSLVSSAMSNVKAIKNYDYGWGDGSELTHFAYRLSLAICLTIASYPDVTFIFDYKEGELEITGTEDPMIKLAAHDILDGLLEDSPCQSLGFTAVGKYGNNIHATLYTDTDTSKSYVLPSWLLSLVAPLQSTNISKVNSTGEVLDYLIGALDVNCNF